MKGAGYDAKAQAHEAAAKADNSLLGSAESKAKSLFNSARAEGERASGTVTGESKNLADVSAFVSFREPSRDCRTC